MANSARLDELKKKFDENPRRYFAPLANEYRKQGDLAQAIALCRTHLPNQPGHISGHIVLAQALYETRELAESRQSFELALDLDPENLIALRYLGDIAREQGAPANAQVWYQRVLEADPRNDEIAQLLRDVEAEAAKAVSELANRPTPAPSATIEEPAPASALQIADLASPPPAEPEVRAMWEEPQASQAAPTSEIAPAEDLTFDSFSITDEPETVAEAYSELEAMAEPSMDDWFAQATPQAPLSTDDSHFPDLREAQSIPVEKAPEPEEVFESFSMDWASEESAEPAAPAPVEAFGLADEPPVGSAAPFEAFALADEPPVDSAAPVEAMPIEAATEEFELQVASAPELAAPVEPPASVTNTPVWNALVEAPEPAIEDSAYLSESFAAASAADESFPWETSMSAPESADSPAAPAMESVVPEAEAEPTTDPMIGRTPAFGSFVQEEPPAPFVTETMAELYLQQGFNEEALAIYKQLLIQHPNDEALLQRVTALEEGSVSPVITPLAPPAIVPRGPSVRTFFSRFALRQPGDGGSAGASTQEPGMALGQSIAGAASAEEGLTRADDAPRSLDEVFSAQGVAAGDIESASTLASAFGSAEGASAVSDLSLQQLFRDVPARSSGAVTHEEFAQASPSSDTSAVAADGEAPQADIEQFTAWLEGLKKK